MTLKKNTLRKNYNRNQISLGSINKGRWSEKGVETSHIAHRLYLMTLPVKLHRERSTGTHQLS